MSLETVAHEWLASRDVIADFLITWLGFPLNVRKNPNDAATAIIARLAAQEPPLLICTAEVYDQRDALLKAAVHARDALRVAVQVGTQDDSGEPLPGFDVDDHVAIKELNVAIAKAGVGINKPE